MKKSKGVTVLLAEQEDECVLPIYSRNGVVKGEVLLDDEKVLEVVVRVGFFHDFLLFPRSRLSVSTLFDFTKPSELAFAHFLTKLTSFHKLISSGFILG